MLAPVMADDVACNLTGHTSDDPDAMNRITVAVRSVEVNE